MAAPVSNYAAAAPKSFTSAVPPQVTTAVPPKAPGVPQQHVQFPPSIPQQPKQIPQNMVQHPSKPMMPSQPRPGVHYNPVASSGIAHNQPTSRASPPLNRPSQINYNTGPATSSAPSAMTSRSYAQAQTMLHNTVNQQYAGANYTHHAPKQTTSTQPKELVSRHKINELISQVHPGETVDSELTESVVMMADNFLTQLIDMSCQLAKHRNSNVLEEKDIRAACEVKFDMKLPGPPTATAKPEILTDEQRENLTHSRSSFAKRMVRGSGPKKDSNVHIPANTGGPTSMAPMPAL